MQFQELYGSGTDHHHVNAQGDRFKINILYNDAYPGDPVGDMRRCMSGGERCGTE
jgi:hypothetical protein